MYWRFGMDLLYMQFFSESPPLHLIKLFLFPGQGTACPIFKYSRKEIQGHNRKQNPRIQVGRPCSCHAFSSCSVHLCTLSALLQQILNLSLRARVLEGETAAGCGSITFFWKEGTSGRKSPVWNRASHLFRPGTPNTFHRILPPSCELALPWDSGRSLGFQSSNLNLRWYLVEKESLLPHFLLLHSFLRSPPTLS